MSGHGTNTEARQFQDGAVVSPPIRDLVLLKASRVASNEFFVINAANFATIIVSKMAA